MFGKRSSGGSLPVGAEITAHFTPAVLPGRIRGLSGLWDVADHRLALISAAPKLFAAIGQAYRLPGDSYDQETHFRYPDGTRLRRGAVFTAPPAPADASYPMDDDGTVASSLGELWLPMLAPDYQSFSYDAGTETFGGITLIASRDAATAFNYAQCKALAAGRVTAVQLQVTACPENFLSVISLILYKLDNTGAVTGSARVGTGVIAGDLVAVRQINSGAYEHLGPVSGPRAGAISIYVNGDTGGVGWTVNGVDLGYIAGFTVAPGERFGFVKCIDDVAGQSGTVTGTFITQAALITEPIPGVAEDLAGNLIGVTPSGTSTVGTRAGTNSAPVAVTVAGHALTESEMPPHHHNLKVGDDANTPVSFGDDRAIATSLQVLPANVGTAQMYDAGGGAPHAHAASGTASIDPEHVKVLRLVRVA